MKAIETKWNASVPTFEVKVNKLPSFSFRTQPKFKTSVSNADTLKSYIFLQLSPDGMLAYGNLDGRQLKIVTLLCLLSDKYYNYK